MKFILNQVQTTPIIQILTSEHFKLKEKIALFEHILKTTHIDLTLTDQNNETVLDKIIKLNHSMLFKELIELSINNPKAKINFSNQDLNGNTLIH